ncbi:MAG: S58 family peptidase [Flavobacteriales bacterium TMED96]|nr:MAG: S58 family peptidase [Flavobacteriales bacterium TMED96]|tara:strand:- start:1455 stop:2567 length:1113 start_codon:yes stop_codon:yes gene_type:complete
MSKNNLLAFILIISSVVFSQEKRARDYGIDFGIFKTGIDNSITDVEGVKVGHVTLNYGKNVRTGVTAIIPHPDDLFRIKTPTAIFIGNGFGKLTGYSQIEELGNSETPIILTNTLSVPTASQALIEYTLRNNNNIRSVNPLVGETNDGRLNDIQGFHVKKEHIFKAIEKATIKNITEGSIGAGTGTVCFGFKGGIGTSSRVIPTSLGGYTVGVLVQTNFGGVLRIGGENIGKKLNKYAFKKDIHKNADGSCMIVIITDAPIDSRNLKRLAKRGMMGLAKTGGIASNGSGDYVIALSVAKQNLINSRSESSLYKPNYLFNRNVSPLFLAAIEATEEAIINSLFAAKTMIGKNGFKVEELPKNKVLEYLFKN